MRSPFAILCSLTIAASCTLIVLLAPMITKTAPPVPGGATVYYQIALLAGAFYAHFLVHLPLRVQGPLHAALGAAALLTLPLAGGVVAMAVLAASVSLVPRWFWLARPAENPWRLFASDFAGGLLALLAEHLFSPSAQAWCFSMNSSSPQCLSSPGKRKAAKPSCRRPAKRPSPPRSPCAGSCWPPSPAA